MELGGAGGSKTSAWGFAMAPHRLRVLVIFFHSGKPHLPAACTVHEGGQWLVGRVSSSRHLVQDSLMALYCKWP